MTPYLKGNPQTYIFTPVGLHWYLDFYKRNIKITVHKLNVCSFTIEYLNQRFNVFKYSKQIYISLFTSLIKILHTQKQILLYLLIHLDDLCFGSHNFHTINLHDPIDRTGQKIYANPLCRIDLYFSSGLVSTLALDNMTAFKKIKAKSSVLPLVAGCSICHKRCLLHVSRWDID